tara:strand:- start:88 stop:705 length:618 start_codon:yes stop_codon:yes gene_type:complete
MIEFWKILFNDSWNIYTKNVRLIIGSLFLMLIPNLILSITLPSIIKSYSSSEMLFFISIYLLYNGIYLGFLNIVYNIVIDKSVSIKQIGSKFYCLPKILFPELVAAGLLYFIFQLSMGLGVIVMLMYFIIFFYYPLIIIIEDINIMSAINKSFNVLKNNFNLTSQLAVIGIIFLILFYILLLSFFVLLPIFQILRMKLYIKMSKS